MTIGLSDDETETFKEFADKFPTFFNSDSHEKNFQLFMELKQMSLVFHKNPSISQNAINAIKDRVEGRPVQTNIIDDKTPPKRQIIDMSDYKKNK